MNQVNWKKLLTGMLVVIGSAAVGKAIASNGLFGIKNQRTAEYVGIGLALMTYNQEIVAAFTPDPELSMPIYGERPVTF